jgi:P4 family phage/plasmid primase-like protien
LIDPDQGAVLCNQCFREANGDGLSALQWLRGWTFPATVEQVADHLHLDVRRRRRSKGEDDLELKDWTDGTRAIAQLWCTHKPGVTLEALEANGGQVARWRDAHTVIALPILSLTQKPVGWIIWNSTGQPLPRGGDRPGEKRSEAKMLVTRGSKPGWVGLHAIRRLSDSQATPTCVWKVEGPTDLLALWAAIPPADREWHLVLTNPFGSMERPQQALLEVFRNRTVCVCHDTDEPGQRGGERWVKAIATAARSARLVHLPADGPKDVRDWLVAGHTYAELVDLASRSEAVPVTAPGTAAAASPDGDVEESDTDPSRLARGFLQARCGHVASYRGEVYYWQDKHWRRIKTDDFRSDVTYWLRKEFVRLNLEALVVAEHKEGPPPKCHPITNHLVASVMANVASFACVSSDVQWGCVLEHGEDYERVQSSRIESWIAVANGIVQLEPLFTGTGEILREHTPDWWSPHCLPYAWEPTAGPADRPRWDAFLTRNLENDPERIALLQEWMGYCLVPMTSYQRFMILEGEGANGKSVICAVLEALVGPENVSHVPLELFGERFQLSSTLGRLLNITAEVGDLDRVAEGHLKAFTAGDRMSFDRKNLSAVEAAPTAKLLIATNNRPRFSDRSQGIWRRMLLLPLRVSIPEGERVHGMDRPEWWIASGEMPAIFNWAIHGLVNLSIRGTFPTCRESQDALDDYQIETNPAKEFLIDTYEPNPDGWVPSKDVYKDYSDWCQANGYRPLGSKLFGKEIRRAFPTVQRMYGGPKASRFWYYQGIQRVGLGEVAGDL